MIHREDRGSVAVLRLDHGKVHALDRDLCDALAGAVRDVERSEARALVLTGTGTSFSAGVDLFRVLDGGRAYVEPFLRSLDDAFGALFAFEKPAVAAVNGHAIAGGGILAWACDHRVMAAGSGRFGVPELIAGVPFPSLALEIVRCATPRALFGEIVQRGALFSPADAHAKGLLDEVVQPGALLARSIAVAGELARIPARSFALVKRQHRAPSLERWRELSSAHDAAVREAWCSDEVQAAIRGHLERTIGKQRA